MTIVAVIQARMSSSRLPGKVMRQLCGRSVLGHVIQRVQRTRRLTDIVVATTTRLDDGRVADEAKRYSVSVYRGSDADVLGRYYHAASGADVVVRITADCPLLDPELLDVMIERFQAALTEGRRIDYLSNSLRPTFPRGLDAELFTYDALKTAYDEATEPYEREHVTPYLYMHPERFVLENYASDRDLSHLRWTLDTVEDLRFLEEVYRSLYQEGEIFSTAAVLALLEARPELVHINAHVRQKTLLVPPGAQAPPGPRRTPH